MYVIRGKTNKTKDKQKTTTMKVLTLLLLCIVAMQCCNATTTMETSNDAITGYVSLGQSTETKDFNLTWTINDDTITFTLSSRGPYDWFAFGLHDQVGQGMANAEVFMCNPQTSNLKKLGTFCQVRNTLNGYSTPSVDATQYIKLISGKRTSTSAIATFSRTLKKSSDSELSYDITNKSMGIIYARGNWSSGSAMPSGTPLQHTYNGILKDGVNFFNGNNKPKPPAPTHRAGVWPNQFDANMTIAEGQLAINNKLITGIFARLRYDFPKRRQLWEYFDMKTGKSVGGELWVGTMLYNLNADSSQCYVSNMTFDILRPNWLQGTNYLTTNYLLRQSLENSCGPVNYTDADLFTLPNTVGLTNSWLVANSPIAEPIRLMGPDNPSEPKTRSILEYITFQPVSKPFDDSIFKIPSSCKSESVKSVSESLAYAKKNRILKAKNGISSSYHISGSHMFLGIIKSLNAPQGEPKCCFCSNGGDGSGACTTVELCSQKSSDGYRCTQSGEKSGCKWESGGVFGPGCM